MCGPSSHYTSVRPSSPSSRNAAGVRRAACRIRTRPLRHQVWDIPEIKLLVTEHQPRRWTRSSCGVSTCGELPLGIPHGQAGPKLFVLIAMLRECFKPDQTVKRPGRDLMRPTKELFRLWARHRD